MDDTYTRYCGIYYFFGIALDVREGSDGLEAAMFGVPAGYEIGLEQIAGPVFRMRGGPLDGAEAEFASSEDGAVHTLRAGGFELARVAPDALAEMELVERFEAPMLEMNPEKEKAFSEVYEAEVSPGDGRRIDYRLPYPKSEFIRFLMENDRFIFHGSGNTEIEQFEPVRLSVEFFDPGERGNLPAVYGTHDGLWAMFFAVIDRDRLDGSIRNGVMYAHNREGEMLALYNFSINKANLPDRPYRTGAVYLLPRESFIRQKFGGVTPSNEWASLSPVVPAASLLVDPEDFPFLDRIGGHDDGPMVRSQVIQGRLFDEVEQVLVLGPDVRKLVFGREADVQTDAAEYIELEAQLMPGVRFVFNGGPPASLEIGPMPPAMVQVLDAALKKRGLV